MSLEFGLFGPLPRLTTPKIPSDPSYPFNNLDSSDVILRSSDGINFYVHKHILRLASPFFRDMFSLKQSTPESTTADLPPVVPVSENSAVIGGVLKLCYPVDEPEMSDVPKVVALLGAAHKYDMKTVKHRLEVPLRSFIGTSPLQVFANACNYRLEGIAREAAVAWRSRPESLSTRFSLSSTTEWKDTPYAASYSPEMMVIPAGTYYRLIQYLRTGDAPTTFCTPTPLFNWPPTNSTFSTQPKPSPDSYYCRSAFLEAFGAPFDINVHAINGVAFPAHKLILSMASAGLRKLIKEGDGESLYLPDGGLTLAVVLRACYPAGNISSLSLSLPLAADVLRAAKQYGLVDLQNVAKQKMEGYIATSPLEVFLRAADVGWTEGARAAAIQLAKTPIASLYDRMMEQTPTRFYFALLKFHFEYRKALINQCVEMSKHCPPSCRRFSSDMQNMEQLDWELKGTKGTTPLKATEGVFPEFFLDVVAHVASHSGYSTTSYDAFSFTSSGRSSRQTGVLKSVEGMRTVLEQKLASVSLSTHVRTVGALVDKVAMQIHVGI